MAKTLATNTNNDIEGVAPYDLYLDKNGNIAMAYDQDAILQACAQAARTILGELIFNTNAGNPYFESLWNGVVDLQTFSASLRKSFLSVGGGGLVTNVSDLTTNYVKNVFSYSVTITTIYGTSAIADELLRNESLNG